MTPRCFDVLVSLRLQEILYRLCQTPLITMKSTRRSGDISSDENPLRGALQVLPSNTSLTSIRLAIHYFLHDVRASLTLQTNPIISATELLFSLPASRDLWNARNAHDWRELYLRNGTALEPIPRVIDALQSPSLLDVENPNVDRSLSALTVLHGFWGQIHAYTEGLKRYPISIPNVHSTHRLGLATQHRELCRDLQEVFLRLATIDMQPIQLQLTCELFFMILHVIPDELQRFAGKFGEEEARRASSALSTWQQSPESRCAIWHAGQVLRAARILPPAELRGFYAIAVYYASLTLWAYGLMSKSHYQTGQPLATPPSRSRQVYLDGEETRDVKAFLTLDQGLPGLTNSNGVFNTLGAPGFVLDTAREIYRSNFPYLSEPLPTLVQNLSNLMKDLGSVASGTGGLVTRAASPIEVVSNNHKQSARQGSHLQGAETGVS